MDETTIPSGSTTQTTIRSATEWAKENGDLYRFEVDMDNYYPMPRRTEYGDLYVYDIPDDHREGIVIPGGYIIFELNRHSKIVFLIDDGSTVQPYYLSGWREQKEDTPFDDAYVLLSKFPTNTATANFRSWKIGPSRCFHLKIRAADRPTPYQDCPDCSESVSETDPKGHYFEDGIAQLCPKS